MKRFSRNPQGTAVGFGATQKSLAVMAQDFNSTRELESCIEEDVGLLELGWKIKYSLHVVDSRPTSSQIDSLHCAASIRCRD